MFARVKCLSAGQPSGGKVLSLSGSLSPWCQPFKKTTVAFVCGHRQRQTAIVSCCNFRQTSSTGETTERALAFCGFSDLVSLFLSFSPFVLCDPAILLFYCTLLRSLSLGISRVPNVEPKSFFWSFFLVTHQLPSPFVIIFTTFLVNCRQRCER